jgi:ribonucleoside-diphosphate reductase alpha chain
MLQQSVSAETPTPSPKAKSASTTSPSDQTVFSYDEAFEATVEYFDGDTFAANVWVAKYALQAARKNDGSPAEYLEKTPADMHRRLAREFARIEARYPNAMSEDEIFTLFEGFRYIVPQGSPMSGIGNPHKIQSLSNCFVIESPQDSYGGILHVDQEQAQIMKRRGGVGFDISTIRPKGLPTANAAVTTDGIGIFMERFSNTTKEVAQGGRRGALMQTCDVHHPEIATFASIKNQTTSCKKCGHEERTKVTGANVSVRLSDEFLEAVEKGESYQLRWPVDSSKPTIEKWVDAKEMWDLIIDNAHKSAEPGLLFWSHAKRMTPSDIYEAEGFGSTATNPCGEIILSPNDSCRLMVVNLASFVLNPFSEKPEYDWNKYAEVVQKAQRLMDDLIELEIEQVDKILAKIEADPETNVVKQDETALWTKIREAAVNGRRTGLGITGLGDAVAMMNLRYGSGDSLGFIEQLYKHLAINSYTSSIKMAEERGAFPVCDVSKEEGHPFIERILAELPQDVVATYREHGRRNIANTTTAPTGSVSILTQTTNGIEPAFALSYMRRKKVNPNDENVRVDFEDATGDSWQHFQILHHAFAKWCTVTGRDFDEVLARIQAGDMSDVEASPYFGAMANDIDWEAKVEAQGLAQKWVCHAISNTTNLPRGTDAETVKKVYMKAWKAGCKGATIYVEGSRDGVLLRDDEAEGTFSFHDAPKRPEKLECDVHHSRVKRGDEYMNWVFLVGKLEGKVYEIFGGFSEEIELSKKIKSGWLVKRSLKGGGKYDFYYGDEDDPNKIKDVVKVFDNPDQGVFTRIVSTSLRHGTPPQYLVEQLQREKAADMFTFAKGMARVLKGYIPDGTKAGRKTKCPECETEDSLVYQEGCVMCTACGHSKCG